MLPVLEQIYQWFQSHRPMDTPYASYTDYLRYELLAGQMVQIQDMEKGLAHPDTSRAFRRIGQVQFSAIRYVMSKGTHVDPGYVRTSGPPPFDTNIEQINTRFHYEKGEDAFMMVVQSAALRKEATAVEHAEAMAQLGDWYLVFEKFNAAQDKYRLAYQILAGSEEFGHLADTYFGSPTPLRFMEEEHDYTVPEVKNPAALTLTLSMTVTRRGDLRYIKFVDPPEDLSKDEKQHIKKRMGEAMFRPGMVNGNVAEFEGFTWSYSVSLEEES
jgi:hypothetical protein